LGILKVHFWFGKRETENLIPNIVPVLLPVNGISAPIEDKDKLAIKIQLNSV
jgi:hypothetical protein